MSNYLNIKFSNDLSGFKSWCNTFKNFFGHEAKTEYYKSGNYYLEINKVKSFLEMEKKFFLGISLREYNEVEKDYLYVGDKNIEILNLFKKEIKDFCDENGFMKDYYNLFYGKE